ncbi:uncharacterized protein BJ212DRAFT_1303589 [Suillus subaureus]|uniref:Uncharacterized protein n=1 Tax=Suillus subaureus TaxID=48587 RepID=A0A9P7DZN0_9AGAM|nr:uncharacterized protein BJ212DRAFT_1303589 [Suillus subaureus]KAG1807130.1 hypothetical protein BJ212DRAFT_1303589 [Suillus subaureus]
MHSKPHQQSPPVTLNRQRIATKHWLAKPGVQDMQNAKAHIRMVSKKNAPAEANTHVPLISSPTLDGLDSHNITPEVDDGSILTMEDDFWCSCDLLTLQSIENTTNCWQKGWSQESEHLWDDAYEKLLEGAQQKGV